MISCSVLQFFILTCHILSHFHHNMSCSNHHAPYSDYPPMRTFDTRLDNHQAPTCHFTFISFLDVSFDSHSLFIGSYLIYLVAYVVILALLWLLPSLAYKDLSQLL